MIIIKNFNNKEEIKNLKKVSLDSEWTKNYKIKNGNVPFNFSLIFFDKINIENIENCKLEFKFISIYIENNREIKSLIETLNNYLIPNDIELLIGHQIASDLSVFKNYSTTYDKCNTSNIEFWINNFKNRTNIFDTRYDIKNYLKNKSRRLVDVCDEFKIRNQYSLYKQPELTKSMTTLHNSFITNNDINIREKLSVLNLRHNLSAILVYILYINNYRLKKYININKILYKNLKEYFIYTNSEDFKKLTKI